MWSITGKTAIDTLIPDLITITKMEQEWFFVIFDAKYYNAKLKRVLTPKGQSGIESVTKQYLYQLAYQEFIMEHEFNSVKNCFLMPTANTSIKNLEEVSMKMLHGLGLQNIKVRLLPASLDYEHYLSGRKIDIKILGL